MTIAHSTFRRRLLAAAAACALLPGLAAAQAFPGKPITIIVPFAAGGTTDILARIIAQGMGGELGQSVV
ncbi:tripartite tricarboxylate transporter substrate binding protein, partial [Escherichia coli]|nr:tripartite tricarboxylate transporter substrate binding protein [Escherichia coli]